MMEICRKRIKSYTVFKKGDAGIQKVHRISRK